METCYEHDIAYEGLKCPMCEMEEGYKDEIAALNEKIGELEAEISGLVDGSV